MSETVTDAAPDKPVWRTGMHWQAGQSCCLQVCGLKWSPDERELASGGNDNQLLIWNAHSTSHVTRFGDHTAAVKAIAWSPHQHGLLASGGGTADRTIRFWNTATSTALSSIDTGALPCVVCNAEVSSGWRAKHRLAGLCW